MHCHPINLDQWAADWKQLPPACREAYVHPDYAHASAGWEDARPLALRVDRPGGFMLDVLLEHPIEDAFDAQTPYGYGGPLFVGQWSRPEKLAALEAQRGYLKARGLVAQFVRCHTHWCDHELLAEAGFQVFQVRTNIECDLRNDDFTAAWSTGARRNLRKAAAAGLTFRPGLDDTDWSTFESIYSATAARLDMTAFYRFDRGYYDRMKQVPGAILAMVDAPGGRPVAAALLFAGGDIAHYHLGGSDAQFLNLRPNDLLYFAMASLARKAGARTIVWGGGTSNDPDDSLYRFKSHFGALHRPVYCAGLVHDQPRFDSLISSWSARNPGRASNRFLKYRA